MIKYSFYDEKRGRKKDGEKEETHTHTHKTKRRRGKKQKGKWHHHIQHGSGYIFIPPLASFPFCKKGINIVMMKKGLEQVKNFVPLGSNIFLLKKKMKTPEREREREREMKKTSHSQPSEKERRSEENSQIFHSEWKLKVIS